MPIPTGQFPTKAVRCADRRGRLVLICPFALLAALSPQGAVSSTTGVPVVVDPDALYLREGESQTLVVGADIHVGDTIQTGETGSAQLLFTDETRIVVGSNATLLIDSALFRSDGTAEKFAVSLTRGAFRFASGKSDSSAYSLQTPTATLGVRGTEFDIYVDEDGLTWLALMDGEVSMCSTGLWPNCLVIRGSCAVLSVDSERQMAAPATREELDSIVGKWFTYIVSQDELREDFHSDTDACATDPQLVQIPTLPGSDLSDPPALGGGGTLVPSDLIEALFPNWPTESPSGPRVALLGPLFPTQLSRAARAPLDFAPRPEEPPLLLDEPANDVSAVIPLPAGIWLLLTATGALAGTATLRRRRNA